MTPVLSAESEKINWINYKTGEKDIRFSMDADNKRAFIGIVFTHKDPEIQQIFFEHLLGLKKIFEAKAGAGWKWQMHVHDEHGRLVSRVFSEKEDVSIYQKENWPALISFFKPRIISLDAFWSQAKFSFEQLR